MGCWDWLPRWRHVVWRAKKNPSLPIPASLFEAAARHGGRIKTDVNFADFPIPLGGEWLHVEADELKRIVGDESVLIETEIVGYGSDATVGYFQDGEFSLGPSDDTDLKFVGETWLTFFETYVLPSVTDQLQLETEIVTVDYSGPEVVLTDRSGGEHRGDAVLVAVPPKIIKDKAIKFVPDLPVGQREAFDAANIWGGMKVFIEFAERFYPTALVVADTNDNDGQKLYYDAAYGQRTATNVLGLFTVGDQSIPYQELDPGEALRDYILAELDEIFDGAATRNYVKHISQNWNEERFIGQAYLADSGDWRLPPRMREAIDGRVLFAGASFTGGSDWGSVHTAAASARRAVSELLSP